MNKLAIVIPAFKPMFLEETLRSIESQTNRDFTLYIGDDASPHHLDTIVEPFRKNIDLQYRFFDKNLGGKDLVAHWERCIDMVRDEEWIWLFSDDDIMTPSCVQEFYDAIQTDSEYDVLHFNVIRIDQYGKTVEGSTDFPNPITIEKFVEARLCSGLRSYVVEYIFNKSHFLREGRFEHFDLAWCSDDASWIKLAGEKGIKTLPQSKVYWRKSPYNITPSYSDINLLKRKNMAMIEYSKWLIVKSTEGKLNIKLPTLKKFLSIWIRNNFRATISYLGYKDFRALVPLVNENLGLRGGERLRIRFILGYKTYRMGVEKVKFILKLAGFMSV